MCHTRTWLPWFGPVYARQFCLCFAVAFTILLNSNFRTGPPLMDASSDWLIDRLTYDAKLRAQTTMTWPCNNSSNMFILSAIVGRVLRAIGFQHLAAENFLACRIKKGRKKRKQSATAQLIVFQSHWANSGTLSRLHRMALEIESRDRGDRREPPVVSNQILSRWRLSVLQPILNTNSKIFSNSFINK